MVGTAVDLELVRVQVYIPRSETELSDQESYAANQSSEEVEVELMEHCYVVGRKGEDGTHKTE